MNRAIKLTKKQKEILNIIEKYNKDPLQMAYLIMIEYDGRIENLENKYNFDFDIDFRNEIIKHIIPKTIK
jgi:hypothetical protein